jgi:hypothetical protein
VSAFSDQLGIDIEEALRTATVPAVPDPFPAPGTPEFAAFMLEGQQNSWKAAAEVLEPHLDTGGLWAPLTDIVTVGSTVTSFTVGSGLSLDADEVWKLLLWLHSATGTTHNTLLGLRGTFTDGTNYASTMLRSDGFSFDRASDLSLCQTNSPDRLIVSIELSKRAGEPTLFNGLATNNGTNFFVLGGRDLATSDVPSVQIGSTASSRILAGTEAQLFRKVA